MGSSGVFFEKSEAVFPKVQVRLFCAFTNWYQCWFTHSIFQFGRNVTQNLFSLEALIWLKQKVAVCAMSSGLLLSVLCSL